MSIENSSVTLRWQNVHAVRKQKKGDKHVLQNVCGIAKPGRLLAIMGSSGAGKTTLLNALTFRSSYQLEISGGIFANDRLLLGSKIAEISAYVQQNDVFYGILTVWEHLWLQAMLRIGGYVSASDKERRVDEVIHELGLTACKHSQIGTPEMAKTLSGGERKRLSLASEILCNPSVLFCDEPTSGLDSFMAENVAVTLRAMAQKGKTIVCVIHQPSSEIFSLFDDLLIIAQGRSAYLGPACKAKSFFAGQGYPCPENYNLAEHFIRVLSVVPGNETQSIDNIKIICDAYDNVSTSHFDNAGASELVKVDSQKKTAETDFSHDSFHQNSPTIFTQLRYIGWRSFVVEFRDWMLFLYKVVPSLAVALFVGLVYLQQENNQRGVQNINGAIFMILALATFSIGFTLVSSFPLEFPIVRRDIENGTYSVLAYYLSKSAAEGVIFTVLSVVMGSLIYWLVGMREEAMNFVIFLLTLVLLTYVIIGFAYTVSCVVDNVQSAAATFGPLAVPAMTFGGFVLNDASIPNYFIWLEYLSWFKYSNSIFMANQWGGYGEIECEFEFAANSSNFTEIAMPNNFSDVSETYETSRCFRNGDHVLVGLNYSEDNYLRDYLGLAALLVSLRLTAFICLYLRLNGVEWFKRKDQKRKWKKKENEPFMGSVSTK